MTKQILKKSILVLLMFSITARAQETKEDKIETAADQKAYRLLSSPSAIPGERPISLTVHAHTFMGLAFTLGASVRLTHSIDENAHIGVGSNVGMLMVPSADNFLPIFYGAGPVFTYGKEKLFFNMSALYYGAHTNGDNLGVFLPSAGISGLVKEHIRLHAEVLVPLTQEKFKSVQAAALLYGARFGKRFYVDVSFIAPIDGSLANVYKYFPLGFPIISIGAGF